MSEPRLDPERRTADARQRVEGYAHRFGEAPLLLAFHCSVPIGLTAELVHLLRMNFVRESPWIAEADLLLSSLCREIGGELYEMDESVRELLGEELAADPELGADRQQLVARFLLAWSSRRLAGLRPGENDSFLVAQQWTALAYLDPADAAQRLAHAIRDGVEAGDTGEAARFADIARGLSAPLAGETELLYYAAGLEHLIGGDAEAAERVWNIVAPAGAAVTVGNVVLPAPASVGQHLGTATRRLYLAADREDEDFAREIHTELDAAGYNVFHYRDDGLQPGGAWRERLREVLERSDALLAVVGPSTARGGWRRDAEIAAELDLPIILLLVSGEPLPRDVSERIKYVAVDFRSGQRPFAAARKELLERLQALAPRTISARFVVRITTDPEGALIFAAQTRGGEIRHRANRDVVKRIVHDLNVPNIESVFTPPLGRALQELIPAEMTEFFSGRQALLLQLDAMAASIPWEAIQPSHGDGRMLGAMVEIVRERIDNHPAPRMGERSRSALLVAPPDAGSPDAEANLSPGGARGVERLRDRMDDAGFEVTLSVGEDAKAVVGALFARPYAILHLEGHGESRPPYRSFPIGSGVGISSDVLTQLSSPPQVAVLNFGFSGGTDAGGGRYDFERSLVGALTAKGVPCIVALANAPDSATASRFADAFYDALLAGMPFGQSALHARRALAQDPSIGPAWVAYQCWGDPDFILQAPPRGEAAPRPDRAPAGHAQRARTKHPVQAYWNEPGMLVDVWDKFATHYFALGDYWFTHPLGNLPSALRLERAALMFACGKPSSTISELADAKRNAQWLSLFTSTKAGFRWDAILVSAGLNDLLKALRTSPGILRPSTKVVTNPAEHIDESAYRSFEGGVHTAFEALVKLRDGGESPNRGVPIIAHTYDYPSHRRPSAKDLLPGPSMSEAFAERGIPQDAWDNLSRHLVDRLADLLLSLELPNVRVIDTRGTLSHTGGDWSAEMIPASSGFARFSTKWAELLDKSTQA